MSAYRFIQAPPTSSVRGATGTGLIQLPSQGSYSGVAMAAPVAAVPVAAAGGGGAVKGLATAFLSDFLANLLSGAVQTGAAGATGALTPSTADVSSGGKYMVTLSDLRDYEQYRAGEDLRRRLLGLPPLEDVNNVIRRREAELRRSAAEAGAREYALEQVRQQGAIQSALAGTVGTGLQSAGGVAQQSIASTLARPSMDPALAETARAF